MATCKDCLHIGVCYMHEVINDVEQKVKEVGCDDFKPAADVVEVRHGAWLQTEEPMGWRDVDCIECSACRESWIMDEDLELDDYKSGWLYCPNCGAKMDGKGEQ